MFLIRNTIDRAITFWIWIPSDPTPHIGVSGRGVSDRNWSLVQISEDSVGSRKICSEADMGIPSGI